MTNVQNIILLREKERKYLLDMTRFLRYLVRQGIALQESKNNDNFTHLMMLLATKAHGSFGRNNRKQIYSLRHTE